MKRRLYIAGAWALTLVAAGVVGRFTAPTKVTETATRSDESARLAAFLAKLETQQTVKTKRHVETRKTKKPDGTIEIVRIEDSGSDTATQSTSTVTGHSSETTASTAATARVTERGRPAWSVGLSASWAGRPSSMPDRLGLEVDRRLIGPVWLGARASIGATLSEPQFGLGLRAEW